MSLIDHDQGEGRLLDEEFMGVVSTLLLLFGAFLLLQKVQTDHPQVSFFLGFGCEDKNAVDVFEFKLLLVCFLYFVHERHVVHALRLGRFHLPLLHYWP